jgi:Ca-activated chloride channel homolog
MQKALTALLAAFTFFSAIISAQTDTGTVRRTDGYSESKPFQPGQEPKTADSARTGKSGSTMTADPAENSADADEIRINSTLVTIPVSVSDAAGGRYLTDIARDEFRIFEDGVEQEIAYFGTFDKPFTVILILDTSPSTRYKIEDIQAAAKFFVDQLKSQDRVEIIKFNEEIRVLAKATTNREKIYEAITKARFDSGTSLYDVVDFALRERLENVSGRKAIVLFTDGVDTTSENGFYDATVELAEKSDTSIFPVYYNTLSNLVERNRGRFSNARGERPEDHKLGRMYLDELAVSTGGRLISPDDAPDGLNAAFKAIAEDLSYQYSIGYYPQNEGAPGQRKNIKVRISRPNLNVRARDSYIVMTQ